MDNELLFKFKDDCFSVNKTNGGANNHDDFDLDLPIFCFNNDFKNRFIFSNLTDECFLQNGVVKDDKCLVDYYEKIANMGVGLIFTGGVSPLYGKRSKNTLDYENCYNVQIFKNMVEKVHINGTKIYFKIKSNFGRVSDDDKFLGILSYSASFNQNYTDSRLKCVRISDQKCIFMCDEIVEYSKFASIVGFDGLVVDATVDGLLGEMSSTEFNKRVFGYFSDFQELSVRLIKKISSRVKNFPIIYKINISTLINVFFEDDLTELNTIKTIKDFSIIDDKLEFMKKLVEVGVDGFIVEFGCRELDFARNSLPFQNNECLKHFTHHIIEHFESAGIKNKFGENVVIVNDELCDNSLPFKPYEFVNITKQLIANNNYLNNKKSQKYNDLCIKCNKCVDFARNFCSNSCAINPIFDVTLKPIFKPNLNKIAIVGAGLSGIICAITLAARGYNVDVYEKGSVINLASKLNEVFGFDLCLNRFNNYINKVFEKYLKRDKINIIFNTKCEFNADFLKNYNNIIIATGTTEKLFNAVGAVQKHVKSIYDVLSSKSILKNKNNISVYVKSELGLKFALYLVTHNFNVNVILKNVKFMFGMPDANLSYYLIGLNNGGAKVYFASQIKKIHDDSVDLIHNTKISNNNFVNVILNMKSKTYYKFAPRLKTIDADLFVYEPDFYSNNKLFYDLVKNSYAGKLFMIGDALNVSGLENAVKTGFYVGNNI